MGWSVEWMNVPRSTTRAARFAIGAGLFYLGVAYVHFWTWREDSGALGTLVLAVLALTSIWCGYTLLQIRPNGWGFAHGYFAVVGIGNIALVPMMFDLPFYLALVGTLLCVVTLVALQTEDAYALAEPEVRAQRPEPVIFKRRLR